MPESLRKGDEVQLSITEAQAPIIVDKSSLLYLLGKQMTVAAPRAIVRRMKRSWGHVSRDSMATGRTYPPTTKTALHHFCNANGVIINQRPWPCADRVLVEDNGVQLGTRGAIGAEIRIDDPVLHAQIRLRKTAIKLAKLCRVAIAWPTSYTYLEHSQVDRAAAMAVALLVNDATAHRV